MMADNLIFPAWYSDKPDGEPRMFLNAADVPAGWVHRVGRYDPEIGQFVTTEQAEERAAAKRKAAEEAEETAEPVRDPVTGRALDAGASAVARADILEGRVRQVDGAPPKIVPDEKVAPVDDSLVDGNVAEIVAGIDDKTDLDALEAAENDREVSRKGVLNAIEKERAARAKAE